jgi:ATP-dependent DNA helicase DinG
MGANNLVFESVMQSLGLTPRVQQVKLVDIIRETVGSGAVQFAQAGTGTGKSYAILTTALETARATGAPSVVVCPMNSLIDQYVNKDAPQIAESTGGDFKYIKGRSRYLCVNSRGIQKTTVGDQGARDMYLELTAKGAVEWAEVPGLDFTFGCPGAKECKGSEEWDVSIKCAVHGQHKPTCDADSCVCGLIVEGVRPQCSCQFYCGAFEAKRKAETADVIITNGHVLVWDRLVYAFTNGMGGLLPARGALFVDECHELEAIARACQSDEIKPGSHVYEYVDGLRDWVDKQALAMLEAKQQEAHLGRDEQVVQMAADGKKRADELYAQADMPGVEKDERKELEREADSIMRFVDFVSESEQHISTMELQPTNPNDDPVIHLRRICVDTSLFMRDILTAAPSVLVSGTIPKSEPRRLGVGDFAKIKDVGHPFDYSKSRLVISNHRGNDRESNYARAQQAASAINSTGGGALLLFTSWLDLEAVVPLINMHLDKKIQSEFYVQSRENPEELKDDIAAFKANGNAVLAGVRTLFTGLDIPGPALRNVILWKLPYAVPTLEMKAIQRIHGQEVYWDQMRTVLVQGVGRLVRTVDDSGLVFIADSRAKSMSWLDSHMTAHFKEFSK